MKIGLYSITYLGCWYRGEALDLPELIRTAKKFGYDGVEIDGKRPHGNPLDWPKARCQELQRLAVGEGIEIHGVAANNDFSNPVPEVREAQICFVRELIRMHAPPGEGPAQVFRAQAGSHWSQLGNEGNRRLTHVGHGVDGIVFVNEARALDTLS